MQTSTMTLISTTYHNLCNKIGKVGIRLSTLLVLMAAFLFLSAVPTLAQGSRPDIVGGIAAEPGEYPWQAWFEFTIGGDTYSCGASLIHPKWVLTASHCIGTINEVVLGAHRIENQNEANRQTIRVKNVFRHPSYDDSTLNNDIALLELTEAAQLNQWVTTISVVTSPNDDNLYAAGVESTVTGWGAIREGGSSPNELQEVNLPIVSRETCRSAYSNELTQNMFCAGFAGGGKDSCQGDSGGPMAVPDGNGGWKQAGVVSWGNGCAQPNAYGVYTRLSNYEGWIAQHVDLSDPNATPTPTFTPTVTVVPTVIPPATPTATVTPVGTPMPTPTATPVPAGAIMNGDFELGPNGDWQELSRVLGNGPGTLITQHVDTENSELANGGGYVAWLGGVNNEVSRIRQNIQVPDGGAVYLTYDYEIQSDERHCRRDRARVLVNGRRLHQHRLCARNSNGWQQQSLDLSEFAGQTVHLDFWTRTNGSRLSSFFVDNVQFTGTRSARSGPASTHDFVFLPLIIAE